MRERNFQLIPSAVIALAAVLIFTESVSAQRFKRGRRASTTVERYQWIVPVQRSVLPVENAPTITVRALLPTPEAELWVDGIRNGSTGNARTVIVSAKNVDGQSRYIVQALWPQENRMITDTRIVDGHPGDRITIDFTRPDPKGTNTEIVPKEVPDPK